MIKYVSVAEMIAIEKEADASGLTYDQMMENAGRGLAERTHAAYSQYKDRGILGLVGSGNNGGDTLVALTLLKDWGWVADAYLVRPRSAEDPLLERFRQSGGDTYSAEADPDFNQMTFSLRSRPVLMDGVLGTGIRLPLKPEVANVLEIVRRTILSTPEIHVVAVDCPSGVDCDSGEAADECIPAELTISMAAAKRGLLKFPAYKLLGDLEFVGIGLGQGQPFPKAWEQVPRFVVDRDWVGSVLPERPLDAHKGMFGTALVVAGSVHYTGAALLAGEAAYRSGAGLVTLGIPTSLHPALAGHFTEATWLPLPEENGAIDEPAAELIFENLDRVTALLLGPGLGLQEMTRAFITRLFDGQSKHRLPPLVLDADGLKLLSSLSDWPDRLPAQAILTPHPGEMSILTGLSTKEIQQSRVEIAEEFARKWGHIVVLKGAFTVIASPNGQTAVIPVASSALARAGTGDVLAGTIVGLRAQGVDAFSAAAAGAWIHAQAGLMAARDQGSTTGVLAGDVLRSIPDVNRLFA